MKSQPTVSKNGKIEAFKHGWFVGLAWLINFEPHFGITK